MSQSLSYRTCVGDVTITYQELFTRFYPLIAQSVRAKYRDPDKRQCALAWAWVYFTRAIENGKNPAQAARAACRTKARPFPSTRHQGYVDALDRGAKHLSERAELVEARTAALESLQTVDVDALCAKLDSPTAFVARQLAAGCAKHDIASTMNRPRNYVSRACRIIADTIRSN